MRRLALLALVLAGCDDFAELEAAALDAGRFADGGAGGGASGGMTAGGSSGGTTAGGSSGGMTGGGSAGGMTAGGAAGGMTAGGAAGGATAGGASGGMTGGGSSGGSTAGGASGGMSAGDGGLRTVRNSAARYLAVAASPANGQLAHVEEGDGGVVVVTVNGSRLDAQGALSDLDARFGMVVLTTTEGVWWLDLQGVWHRVGGTPATASVGLSTPIFRAAGEQQPRLASYWRADSGVADSGVALYSSPGLPNGGPPPPVSSVSASLPPPQTTFRVRPDEGGDSGVIAGFSNDGLCGSGPQFVSTFARIGSFDPTVQGGSVRACDMLVASSEDQRALLVWRAVDAGLGERIRAAFWQPRGSTTLPTEPDYWLDSNNGFSRFDAIATNGARHAAIVSQPSLSTVTLPDAGLITDGGHVLIMVGGPDRPRMLGLGPATPPFGVAFGVHQSSAGLFVLANCPANTMDAGGPLCTGLSGGVVTFLPSEF